MLNETPSDQAVVAASAADHPVKREQSEAPRRHSEAASAVVAFAFALGLLGCWLALRSVVGA